MAKIYPNSGDDAFNTTKEFVVVAGKVTRLMLRDTPTGYRWVLEQKTSNGETCGEQLVWHLSEDCCGCTEGPSVGANTYDIGTPGTYRLVAVRCNGLEPDAIDFDATTILTREIADPNGILASKILSESQMSKCPADIVVTETGNQVMVTVDDVTTSIPKFVDCSGDALNPGESIATCDDLANAIGGVSTAVVTNAPITGDGTAGSPLDIDFASLSSADTSAILSSLDLNDCAGNNHSVGASIPSCAEMDTAIADAINGIPETTVVANAPLSGNGSASAPLDINFASLSSADSAAILSSLDLNDCAGSPIQSGASVATCQDLQTALNSGVTPTGPASGDLVGNYPNPTVNWSNAPTDVTSQTAASNPLTRGMSAGQVNKLINIPAPYADIVNSSPDLEVSYQSMTKVFSNRATEGGITNAGIMNTDGSVGHATLLVSSAQDAIDNNGATWRITPDGSTFTLPNGVYPGQVLHIATAGGTLECVISGTFSGTIRKSDHSINVASGVTNWIFRRGEAAKLIWSGGAWWVAGYSLYLFKATPSTWREELDGTFTIRGTISPVPAATVVNEFFPVALTSGFYSINVTPHQTAVTPDVASAAVELDTATLLTQFGVKHDKGNSRGFRYVVTGAVPDYAALGGIASF